MIIRTNWLLRPDEADLSRPQLTVDDQGRITSVQSCSPSTGQVPHAASDQQVLDFGAGSIIIPGLVNAHTHLELSHVGSPIDAGGSFTSWLGRIIDINRRTTADTRSRAVAEGARRSLAAGVTCLGDISYGGDGWTKLRASPIRSTRFVEIFGHRPREVSHRVSNQLDLLARQGFMPPGNQPPAADDECRPDHRAGLSPHAPYSAGVRAFMAARRAADQHNLPLATHLHEHADEIELYRSGRGTFRKWLPLRALLTLARFKPTGRSPIATLGEAGFFSSPVLVAHANYLDDADIEILRRSRSSVVYCPRSHAHFNHPPHPVRLLLQAGVNVALGTDSLASSPSLSILDEMRFLRQHRPDISPGELLRMATSAGATALGRAESTGRLLAGQCADAAVLAAPTPSEHSHREDSKTDPYNLLLDPATRVVATIIGGKVYEAS